MARAKEPRDPVGNHGDKPKSSALRSPGPKKAGAGRPTKWKPEYAQEAERLATIGVSQKDMAYFWGVDQDTVTNWLKRFSLFSDALKKGEAKKHRALLQAMFRNAVEFRNPALQIFLAKNWLGMKDVQDHALPSDMPIKIQIIPATVGGNGSGGNGGNGGNGGEKE